MLLQSTLKKIALLRKSLKSVAQATKISKIEIFFSKLPSQLELGGEHLSLGTAREVHFKYCFEVWELVHKGMHRKCNC